MKNKIQIEESELNDIMRDKAFNKWFEVAVSSTLSLIMFAATTIYNDKESLSVFFHSVTGIICILVWLITTGMFIWFAWVLIKRLLRKEPITIMDRIKQASEYKRHNYYIILPPKKTSLNGKTELLFPVKEEADWDSLFLPKINKKAKSTKQDIISDILSQLNINEKIPLEYELLNIETIQQSNIKKNSEELYISDFDIVYTWVKSPFFRTYLYDSLEKVGFKYMKLSEIRESSLALTNKKVLNVINENYHTLLDLVNEKDSRHSGIIWNLDKNCGEGCDICAYNLDDKKEVPPSIKQQLDIIDNLKGLDIGYIDIAIGNKINVQDRLIQILRKAKEILTTTQIRLTTTSEVLKKTDLIINLIKEYNIIVDITYDYHSNSSTNDARKEYSQNNIKFAKYLIEQGIKVHAHCVLKDDNIKDLSDIMSELETNNISEILFIRLMPVGKLYDSYDKQHNTLYRKEFYQPVINICKNDDGGETKTQLHCSLRGLTDDENHCTMGYYKLGISPNGDVYICPWAEHLKNNDSFKLDSILGKNNKLLTILLKDKFLKILSDNKMNKTKQCKIFAYKNKGNIFAKQGDKLYL